MKHSSVRTVIMCIVGLALFAVQGIAVPVPPLSMTGMIVGQPELGSVDLLTYGEFELEDGGKKWKLKDAVFTQGAWDGAADITVEEIEFDPDPIIYNNILVANNSGVTQTYQFDITLPTTWAAGPIRGSIDTSVIGGNALLQAPTGGSVYDARIDGVSVRTLQDDIFALGTGQSATSDFVNFGWEPNAVPVTTDIGIRLTFSLSPGATAAILSDFEVIPEPASIAMIGLVSGFGLFIRRDRKSVV